MATLRNECEDINTRVVKSLFGAMFFWKISNTIFANMYATWTLDLSRYIMLLYCNKN